MEPWQRSSRVGTVAGRSIGEREPRSQEGVKADRLAAHKRLGRLLHGTEHAERENRDARSNIA